TPSTVYTFLKKLDPMPQFERQLRCGRYTSLTSWMFGAASANGLTPPAHDCGMVAELDAYNPQSGVGTAEPTQANRSIVPGSPVETDGSARSDASTKFRNSPIPPRIVVLALFCHVNPSRG